MSRTVRCSIPPEAWPKVVLARTGTGNSSHRLALVRDHLPDGAQRNALGNKHFYLSIVFTRIGTAALASSQIAMTIENFFIVAASGVAPAAVASIGCSP